VTHNEFNHILSSINGLSPDQMRKLFQELERQMRAPVKQPAPLTSNGASPEETAFDVASRAGLIGCIKGLPRSPTDLSTNPKHMEGFGHG